MANKRKVHSIHRDLYLWVRKSRILTYPNFYLGRYEADLFSVDDKKDMIIEYEIKIAKSDFKIDFLKCRFRYDGSTESFKHDLIKTGKRVHRFYFVTPKDLVFLSDVPPYAGLIYYDDRRQFKVIKRAPVLGEFQLPHGFYKDLAVTAAYREGNIRVKYQYRNAE